MVIVSARGGSSAVAPTDLVVDVRAYGAKVDGTTDDFVAVQDSVNKVADAGFGAVYFPPGETLIKRPIVIPNHQVYLVGSGPKVSAVRFQPLNADTTLFEFNFGTSQILDCGIRDLGIRSGAGSGAVAKTAVKVYDARNFFMENVHIHPWTGPADIPSARGLYILGRDVGTYRKLWIEAGRPIHLGINPNDANKDMDHHHFSDLYIASGLAPYPSIYIDPGWSCRMLTFDGYQAWVNGGLYWVDGAVSSKRSSEMVSIHNLRVEQFTSPPGVESAIRIEKNAAFPLRDLEVSMSIIGPNLANWNGITANNVDRVTARHCTYDGSASATITTGTLVKTQCNF